MSYSKIPLSTALVSLSVRRPRFISIPRKNRERHRNRETRRAGKNSDSDREPTGGLAYRLWCSIPLVCRDRRETTGASLLDGVALFCYVFTHTKKGVQP